MTHPPASMVPGCVTLKSQLEAFERELILGALVAAQGNQRRAAVTLGLLPTTLHEKMKRLGLLEPPSGPPSRRT